MKKTKIILYSLFGIYLIVSALFLAAHIDFAPPPEVVGMGFPSDANTIRLFLNAPFINSTYTGISPNFLWIFAFRALLAQGAFWLAYSSWKERSLKWFDKVLYVLIIAEFCYLLLMILLRVPL